MKECWDEGELRAYLDHELPADEQEQAGKHLKVCAECSERYLELAERAARVGSLIGLLPEPQVRRAPLVMPAKKWVIAVAALAAAVSIGYIAAPKAARVDAPIALQQGRQQSMPAPAMERTQVAIAPAVVRQPAGRNARAHNAVLRQDGFLSLDGEPIETGVVMRVGVQGSDVEAELIVGPDGRAHAIRLVSSRQP